MKTIREIQAFSSNKCDEGVRLPENPYKPNFNQNSMIERFGDLEDEFKVE